MNTCFFIRINCCCRIQDNILSVISK
jgi:hypothetical protein